MKTLNVRSRWARLLRGVTMYTGTILLWVVAVATCTTESVLPTGVDTPNIDTSETESPDPGWPLAARGCDRWRPGPVCVMREPSPLVVYVQGERPPLVVRNDALIEADEWESAEAGYRVRVTATPPEQWTVQAEGGRWEFSVEQHPLPRVEAALKQFKAGDPEGAERELRAVAMDPTSEAGVAAAYWLGEVAGFPLPDVEARATEAEHWWWAARTALLSGIRALGAQRRSAPAFAALARVDQYRRLAGGHLGYILEYGDLYVRAHAHQLAGNHRGALGTLDRQLALAQALGDDDWVRSTHEDRAQTLARLGRHEEALSGLAREWSRLLDGDECTRALFAINYAWVILMAAEEGASWAQDPVALLDEALRLREQEVCFEVQAEQFVIHARINRALAKLNAGDLRGAEADLAALGPDPTTEPWFEVVQGRLHLAESAPQAALHAFEALERSKPEDIGLRWQALAGQGYAHEQLGQSTAAIQAFGKAHGLMFDRSLSVPVQLGRSAFVHQRTAVSARLAALLREQGDVREAFDVQRAARAQYLASLYQRSRLQVAQPPVPSSFHDAIAEIAEVQRAQAGLRELWELPADEVDREARRRARLQRRASRALDTGFAALGFRFDVQRRRPEAGELMLGWFEGTDQDWVGYAEDAEGIRIATHPGPQPPAASALFAPFADAVSRASTITWLSSDRLDSVDAHAAMVRGRPVLSYAPVFYGLDVTSTGPAEPPRMRPSGSALVVTDPRRDLSGARASSELVTDALRARGLAATVLEGEGATVASALARLDGLAWLHFDGHGEAAEDWESALILSDGALHVADVLALPRPPQVVVINACEMAMQPTAGAVAMATAWIASGSSEVIATRHPISDEAATAFSSAFYPRLANQESIAHAYAATVLDLQRTGHGPAAFSYRLFRK